MYDICGNCLHPKESHSVDNFYFMRCHCCFALCDNKTFNLVHAPTRSVVQDGIKIVCSTSDKQVNNNQVVV